MLEASVYLIADAERDAFKVGISVAPYRRATSVVRRYDAERSGHIRLGRQKAFAIERQIHAEFAAHRSPHHGRSGGTEWFDGSAYPQVRERLCALTAATDLTPIGPETDGPKVVVVGPNARR